MPSATQEAIEWIKLIPWEAEVPQAVIDLVQREIEDMTDIIY